MMTKETMWLAKAVTAKIAPVGPWKRLTCIDASLPNAKRKEHDRRSEVPGIVVDLDRSLLACVS